MRFHKTLSSCTALAALCSLLVVSGCGGDGVSEDDGSNPSLYDGELGGASGSTPDDAKGEGQGDGADSSGKVTVCHVPPGNPANAHTIVISVQGWENGHKRHRGDSLGACEGSGDADGGTPDTDGGTGEPDADGGTGEPDTDGGTGEPDAGPVCAPQGSACSEESIACCDGLQCVEGTCLAPIIIN